MWQNTEINIKHCYYTTYGSILCSIYIVGYARANVNSFYLPKNHRHVLYLTLPHWSSLTCVRIWVGKDLKKFETGFKSASIHFPHK